MLLELCEK